MLEPTTRAGVTVTFLRLDQKPQEEPRKLPDDATIVQLTRPSVAFYRYLYNTIGASYVWWLRRATPDGEIAALLAHPAVSVHVLYRYGEPQGFFELDGRAAPDINLSYFGLMPQAIGSGLGKPFLRAAIDAGFARSRRGLTLNTCTADHPRALPHYLATGFKPMRTVRELWDIPNRLGLHVPQHLRIGA